MDRPGGCRHRIAQDFFDLVLFFPPARQGHLLQPFGWRTEAIWVAPHTFGPPHLFTVFGRDAVTPANSRAGCLYQAGKPVVDSRGKMPKIAQWRTPAVDQIRSCQDFCRAEAGVARRDECFDKPQSISFHVLGEATQSQQLSRRCTHVVHIRTLSPGAHLDIVVSPLLPLRGAGLRAGGNFPVPTSLAGLRYFYSAGRLIQLRDRIANSSDGFFAPIRKNVPGQILAGCPALMPRRGVCSLIQQLQDAMLNFPGR